MQATLSWKIPGKAFVRTVNGVNREYWVHVEYDGYRDPFLDFFAQEYRVPRPIIPPSFHVDHTVNRGFARRTGLSFVRLALLRGVVNASYGSGAEKKITRIDKAGRRVVLMDYLVLMKVLDISPPASWADYQSRRTAIVGKMLWSGVPVQGELLLDGMDGFFSLWQVL